MSLKQKIEFPFLELPQKLFRDGNLQKIFPQRINLPDRRLPPKFSLEKENAFCGGYFVCYNKKLTPNQVMEYCQSNDWQFLANLVADFLIVYCDFFKREVYVLTDQTGKFPCYFSLGKNKLVLSTDFGLVKKALVSYTLDLSAAFSYLDLTNYFLASDETILSEIKQIPPGVLFKIKSDFSYSLVTLVDIDSFFGQKVSHYTSFEEFADDFVLLLAQLVKERLEVLGNQNFGADLSSGFDSSLICYLIKRLSKIPLRCYTWISKRTLKDTDPKIVEEFARKHSLDVDFCQVGDFYPFSEFDLQWTKEKLYPGSPMVEIQYISLKKIAKTSGIASFNGVGGDEVYGSPTLEDFCRFPAQFSYFYGPVNSLKFYHLGRFLSKKGRRVLLDKERFSRKKYFPTVLSPSAVLGTLIHHSVYWETDIWPMTPFIDPRLVQFARRLPSHKPEGPLKPKMWAHRKDIFVESQFKKEKWHFGGLVNQFVTKRPDFVVSVLENSILGRKGLIQTKRIIEDLRQGKHQFYLNGTANTYFHNLLRLEYFLQQNNIRVPDYT